MGIQSWVQLDGSVDLILPTGHPLMIPVIRSQWGQNSREPEINKIKKRILFSSSFFTEICSQTLRERREQEPISSQLTDQVKTFSSQRCAEVNSGHGEQLNINPDMCQK